MMTIESLIIELEEKRYGLLTIGLFPEMNLSVVTKSTLLCEVNIAGISRSQRKSFFILLIR